MPVIPPATQALLMINTVIFALDQLSGGLLTHYFALYPLGGGFMPWQLLTYGFLHGGFEHIFFNMWGLWMFGSELERVWGRQRFLQFYLASVVAAGLMQLLVDMLLNSPFPTLGASGGIYGLLMAYGMLFPNRQIMLLIPPIPMKARTFVFVFGAIELFMGVIYTHSGVAHFAHLGGMLGGWLVLRYWRGQPPFGRRW